jgi:outer membrane protein OmpA-like peptidoglycan-associated protein
MAQGGFMKKFLMGLLLPGIALAQSQETLQFNAELFRPSPGISYLSVRDAKILSALQYQFGAFLNFADDPLIVVDENNNETKLVDNQFALDIMGAIGLGNYVEVGMAIPIALFQDGDTAPNINTAEVQSGQLGDIRLSAKLRVIGDPKAQDGFFLSVIPELTLPSGNSGSFFGSAGSMALFGAAASYRNGPLALGFNAGFRFQSEPVAVDNLNLGNSADVGLGVSYQISKAVSLLAEADGSLALSEVGITTGQSPIEGRAGAKIRVTDNIIVPIGLGTGLTNGVGAPDIRVLAGLMFAPTTKLENPLDSDGDGIVNESDACPTVPEDKDGFQDEDGCIDDNDGDGVADLDDACPAEPGLPALKGCPDTDRDNIADKDDACPTEAGLIERKGCPEPDTDKDAIFDKDDACPTVPGLVIFKGCPDTDGDGIADKDDKCIDKPEDFDQIQDADGCPEDDADADKFADKDDVCPLDPEDNVGNKEGCPESIKATRIGNKIVILDKVFFDTNKATLQTRSYPVLNAVATLLKENPDLKKVMVEGHTDDVGDEKKNQTLSEGRAKSVREYLIAQGVDGARLESIGYGEAKPLEAIDPKSKDKKELKAKREKNRRVEFTIVQ